MARSRRSRRSSRGRRKSRVGDYGRRLYSRARMNPYRAAGYGALGAAGLGAGYLGARALARRYPQYAKYTPRAVYSRYKRGKDTGVRGSEEAPYMQDIFSQGRRRRSRRSRRR